MGPRIGFEFKEYCELSSESFKKIGGERHSISLLPFVAVG